MISRETIERIKERASLLEIVSEYTQVKRSGSRYYACCPFHQEKTPSFLIKEEEGYYKCFGCQAKGNIFSFLMEIRGLSFPEAVEELADRYSIEIQKDTENRQIENKDKIKKYLFEANEVARQFFVESLRNSSNQVKSYLNRRQITNASIRLFSIGYAPGRKCLVDYLRTKKISEEVALVSGLLKRRDNGEIVDTFRDRLIFPIWFDNKRVAGFGGRIIPELVTGELQPPKYLNSPESLIYNKSRLLFASRECQKFLRSTKTAYLVEGYLDVIGLSQVGVGNVLATCGTSLTPEHVEKLSHIAKKVIILFDGDPAGYAAAAKSFLTFLNSRIDVFATFLPEGEDPDSIAMKKGMDTVSYLEELPKKSLLDCYLEFLVANEGVSNFNELGNMGIVNVARQISSVLAQVADPLLKEKDIQHVAFKLRIKDDLLRNDAANHSAQSNLRRINAQNEINDINADVNDLSKADQGVIISAIALKDTLPNEILSNPKIIALLSESTLSFISSLSDIMMSQTDHKERIRELLSVSGKSWVDLWQKAYRMKEISQIDFKSQFLECINALERARLSRELDDVRERVRKADSESQQADLAREQIEIVRQLKGITA